MNLDIFLAASREAAEKSGIFLRDNIDSLGEIEFKGAVDLVTNFDRQAQNIIFDSISSRFPEHNFLAEEELTEDKGSDFRWIVDPLDGTTNFAHHFPVFAVSIALEYKKKVIVGTVYDPMRDEMFSASRGNGAWLNGKGIRASAVKELDKSLLATGFPYDVRHSRVNNIDNFCLFMVRAQGIRRGGAAALDLCYVACGRFDGFWELKLQPWDLAAGALIVEEAGGRISDFKNEHFSLDKSEILASNGWIHDQMIEILHLTEDDE